jgi:hypothetical protein
MLSMLRYRIFTIGQYGFCRKAFVLIEVWLSQACLCRELGDLLEGGETVWRDLPLSDHLRCFDACDGEVAAQI